MMEFVRTAIKDNNYSFGFKHLLMVVALSLVTLVVLAFGYWLEPELPAGRLRTVGNMVVPGGNGLKAMAIAPNGELYVADSRNNRIVVLNEKGRVDRVLDNKTIKGDYDLKYPVSVAVNKDKIWVGCYLTKQILVLDEDGKVLDVLPRRSEQEGLRDIAPQVLTVDQAGNLYAVDGEKQTITVFDSKGKIKLVFGGEGFAANKFSHINGLVVDEKNNRLIIQDSGNLRLVFSTKEGKFLNQTIFLEKGKPVFAAPRGLEYDENSGVIYIADALLDMVFALDEQGNIIAKNKETLSFPQALALGNNGYLYAANREDKKIIKMNP